MSDLTPIIRDPSKSFKINIMCHDKDPYIFVLAFCQYRPYSMLHQSLTTPDSPYAITRLSEVESRQKALQLASNKILVIDEGLEAEEEVGKIEFSLKDSTTKKFIDTPVRGKYCTHFQVCIYCSLGHFLQSILIDTYTMLALVF